jgi:hypothetical protein
MSQPYKSGRQQNLNLGITSITENKTVLQTIGKVGIGTTNAQHHSLYVVGSTNIVGDSNVTGVGTFGSVNSNVGIFTNITATGFATVGTLYVQNGATLFNDLLVYGNVSIAGTTVAFFAQDLRIKDKDLILGVTTAPGDPNGDYSTDDTANHGGIAIASTEGSYLVPLQKVGINSLPETYKQFMWSKHDTFGIGTTDAWLSNQAVGIGSTLVPNGVRLAVGDVKVTDNTVTATNGNFTNITGISASYTSGSFTNGYFGSISSGNAFVGTGIVTNISGTNLNYSGIGTINTLNGTDATFTNVSSTSITAQRISSTDINLSGISTANAYYVGATRVISSGRALENIASIDAVTKATFEAALENAPNNFSDLSVAGIATLNILGANNINVTGVVTARQFIGDVNAGVTTIGFATITSLYAGITTIGFATITSLYAGIGTIGGVKISNGIVTSSSPGVTTVKYYGDGSNLIGVNAFNVVQQTLTASPVYPTFANSTGVTSIGIAPTEIGYVPTSGNLGIGSTNPTAKLNVVGNAIFTGIVTARKFVGDIEATGPTSIISATNLYVSGIGTIDGVTIASGVVTSSQPGVTTVKYYGDGSNLIGVNAFNVIQQDITSSPVFPTFANSVGVSSIGIAATQIGYVPASGNLGIGSTNPTAKLQVVGNVLVSGVTTARQFVGDVNAGIATINKLDVNQISPDGVDFGGSQYILRSTGSGTWEWASVPGIFSVNNILNGFIVYDEGSVVGTAGSITTLDFRGNNIIASANPQPNGIATVRVSDTPTFLNLTVTPGISTLGHINATSATFSGNVSIAGTLTYEDVTNVDSIGIITARSDVSIGGGLSVVGVSTLANIVINGTVSTGSTVGASGQYLQSTGVGVTWATFPTLRTTQTNIATAGQSAFSFAYNINFLDVFVNGVKLTTSEYIAVNGNSITLNSPAFANDIVEFVSYNTTSTGGSGGGGGATIIDDLTDVNLSLPLSVGENLSYDGTYWVNDYTVTATTSTVSQTSIHTLSASSYRSVEYVIQATQGTNYHATKILAIHDGSLAYPSEYGIIYTNGSLGDFDVDISGGNMRLLVTPTSSSSTTYKIKFTAIKI